MISKFVASASRLQLLTPLPSLFNGYVGVVDASFNPPHNAHLELAARLCARFPGCSLVLMLSTGNADKQAAPLDQLEHRLEMVTLLAQELAEMAPTVTIALTKEPYFIDKSRALHAVLPHATQVFAMGSDTIVRLYDQKYYTVPVNSVMDEFFQWARILVLDRASDPASKVDAVDLAQFKDKITLGKIAVETSTSSTAQVSSSRARAHDLSLVPKSIAEYITRNGLYNR